MLPTPILIKAVILFCFLMTVKSTGAQVGENEVVTDEDLFGISIGLSYGAIQLDLISDTTLPVNAALWGRNAGGASFGFRYQKSLSQNVKVGAQLNIVLLRNDIIYEDDEGLVIEKPLYPAVLEVPLHFSFSNKKGDHNISAHFGVKLSRLVSSLDKDFILRDSFTSADFGLGKELEFKRFTMSPEITYSFGLENLYRQSSINEFSTYIQSITVNQLSLKLHFY